MIEPSRIYVHRANLHSNDASGNDYNVIRHILRFTNFKIELDVWQTDDGLLIGHDLVTARKFLSGELEDLRMGDRHRIILHCKNWRALDAVKSLGFDYFFHDSDILTHTKNGTPWFHPIFVENLYKRSVLEKTDVSKLFNCYPKNSILVFPESLVKFTEETVDLGVWRYMMLMLGQLNNSFCVDFPFEFEKRMLG